MTRGSAWAFGALAGAMLVYPAEAAEAARKGLLLWATSVLPVLGPYMACMLMAVSRLSPGPWEVTALGWLCGSPGGARLMQGLHLRGKDAVRFAAAGGTMSPLFFLGTVSDWLGSAGEARMILCCHWLGALALALLLPKGHGTKERLPPSPLSLASALRETALSMCTVALCMMLGGISARMAACALPALPKAAAAALQCFLEVTSGVKAIAALHAPHAAAWTCAACSFGGLSLLMQNAAFWQESGVGMGRLLALRAAHGALSGGLCLLLSAILTNVVY